MCSRTSLYTPPPEGLACCFLKAVIQTNGGFYIVLRETPKHREKKHAATMWTCLAEAASHQRVSGSAEMKQNCFSRYTKDTATTATMTTTTRSEKEKGEGRAELWSFPGFIQPVSELHLHTVQRMKGRRRERKKEMERHVSAPTASRWLPPYRRQHWHTKTLHKAGLCVESEQRGDVCPPFRDVPREADLEEEPESDLQKGFVWRATASSWWSGCIKNQTWLRFILLL